MRGKSPHLCHFIFLLSNYLCCLLAARKPHLFYIISLFGGEHHTSYLPLSQLTSSLSRPTHPSYNASSVARPHVHPPSPLPICHIFLAGVNVMLVIWCLIVCLGFEVLDLVLHICHSPIQSLLCNYIGPFFLVVLLVWNRCILASFSPLNTLLFHFYILVIRQQALICVWRWRNLLLMKSIFLGDGPVRRSFWSWFRRRRINNQVLYQVKYSSREWEMTDRCP